jgi:DNA-binding NarL/FixJ family response regulator
VTIGTRRALAPTALRVVLVDARPERRQVMLRVVEGTEAGATVVAQADDEAAALALVHQHHADAVVLDIQMPVEQGLRAIKGLRGRFPGLAIVVCSFHLDNATRERAMAEGADVYLGKPISPRELNAALRKHCPARPPEVASPEQEGEPVLAGHRRVG